MRENVGHCELQWLDPFQHLDATNKLLQESRSQWENELMDGYQQDVKATIRGNFLRVKRCHQFPFEFISFSFQKFQDLSRMCHLPPKQVSPVSTLLSPTLPSPTVVSHQRWPKFPRWRPAKTCHQLSWIDAFPLQKPSKTDGTSPIIGESTMNQGFLWSYSIANC